MGMTERERKDKVSELQLAYKNAHKTVARLSKIGTDTPRAKAHLLEAQRAFDKGDYVEVRHNIAEAISTARDSTHAFLNLFTIETLRILDWLRTEDIDISPSEPRIAAADMELRRLAFGRAARLLIKSIESIVGISPRFHDVLVELVMADYNLVLAESFGLHLPLARA